MVVVIFFFYRKKQGVLRLFSDMGPDCCAIGALNQSWAGPVGVGGRGLSHAPTEEERRRRGQGGVVQRDAVLKWQTAASPTSSPGRSLQ